MPQLTVCLGCGQLTTNPQRCPTCQTNQPTRVRNTPPPPWKTAYNTAAWYKLRDHILDRDNHTCYRCGGHATTADHLQSMAAIHRAGHDWRDWFHNTTNLAAICTRCNRRKGATTDRHG